MKPRFGRNDRRYTGYTPVVPKAQKKNKKKAQKFVGPESSPELAKKGMEMELSAMKQRTYLYYFGILVGTVLTLLDIKDKGLLFEGLGFKFSGSLVGVLVVVVCVIAMSKNKTDVTVSK